MLITNENKAEVGLCLYLAGADGDVSTEELAEIRGKIRAMVEKGTSDGILDTLVDAERGEIEDQGRPGYLTKLKDRIKENRREPALRAAVDVAFADVLTVEEDRCVREVVKALGLSAKLADELAGPAIG